jgi:hypothetical protein
VFSDHDIAESGTGVTGLNAAMALVASKPDPKPVCVVHSWNQAGALRIYDALLAAGYEVYKAQFESSAPWASKVIRVIERDRTGKRRST